MESTSITMEDQFSVKRRRESKDDEVTVLTNPVIKHMNEDFPEEEDDSEEEEEVEDTGANNNKYEIVDVTDGAGRRSLEDKEKEAKETVKDADGINNEPSTLKEEVDVESPKLELKDDNAPRLAEEEKCAVIEIPKIVTEKSPKLEVKEVDAPHLEREKLNTEINIPESVNVIPGLSKLKKDQVPIPDSKEEKRVKATAATGSKHNFPEVKSGRNLYVPVAIRKPAEVHTTVVQETRNREVGRAQDKNMKENSSLSNNEPTHHHDHSFQRGEKSQTKPKYGRPVTSYGAKPFSPTPLSPPPGSFMEMFSKKKKIKGAAERFTVPTTFGTDLKWKNRELESLKAHINSTKSLLNDLNLDQWHMHTKRMNPAGEVPVLLRKRFAPEYCSQAWCKFFECLSSYPIIPQSLTDAAKQHGDAPIPFNSVHLCEAPGAFVSATNHFIKTRCTKIEWKWLATTLNPYFEGNDVGKMINEDQLMMTSQENWTFLKDTTGNIMSEDNIEFLKEEVTRKFSIHGHGQIPVSLVTADGSIDCQSFPCEQESIVAKLQFSEIVAALSILSPGGNFVLKIFTFFENQTISHLYILCCLFQEVHLFKPATSKEGNSEVYVICLGYYGPILFEAELNKLKKLLVNYDELVVTKSIVQRCLMQSGRFIDRIVDASKFFTLKQDNVIRRNLDYFKLDVGSRYFTNNIMREELAYEWITRFQVTKLHPSYRLFRKDELISKLKSACHVDSRVECGTFNDKLKRSKSTEAEKLDFIYKDLTTLMNVRDLTEWFVIPLKLKYENLDSLFVPKEGKKFDNILSSRFCFGKPLALREELRQLIIPLPVEIAIKQQINFHSVHKIFKIKEEFCRVLPDLCPDDAPSWRLFPICFSDVSYHTMLMSDCQKLLRGLTLLIENLMMVRSADSLFLCEFPLLSRLHVGMLCAVSVLFQSTHICYGVQGKPTGIILHRFIDNVKEGRSEVWKLLLQVMRSWFSPCNFGITELVPLSTLINLEDFQNIFNYNMWNLGVSLNNCISLAQRIYQTRGKQKPTSGKN